jgi:hypothetical protein
MSDVAAAVQIDLALHFGLAGSAISLFLWRIGDAGEVLRSVRMHSARIRAGFASARVSAQYWVSGAQCLLKLIGGLSTVLMLRNSLKYIDLVERLVGPEALRLDGGIFDSLWHESEIITAHAIVVCGVATLAFFGDYCLALIGRYLDSETSRDQEVVTHPFVIPKDWKDDPAALWEERIRLAVAHEKLAGRSGADLEQALDSGDWRRSWSVWARCVVAFGRLAAEQVGTRKTAREAGYRSPQRQERVS